MKTKTWKHVFVTFDGETFTFYSKATVDDDDVVKCTLYVRGPGGLYRKLVFPDPKDFAFVDLFLDLAEEKDTDMYYAANTVNKYDGEMAFLMMKAVDWEDVGYALLGDYLAYIKGDFPGAFDAYSESAKYDNIYSICKLGCLYAEGKGCSQDLTKAKDLFEDILSEYPDAGKYLDQYGLR